jgi:uncharacterized Fe-S cluster-containing protein
MTKKVADGKPKPVGTRKRNDWKGMYKRTAELLDESYKKQTCFRADIERLRKELDEEKKATHAMLVRQLHQMSVWDRLKISFYGPAV